MKKVKRLPIFDEFRNSIYPYDIPLGLPRFDEYCKISKKESLNLLKRARRLRWKKKNRYEAEYLKYFIKSLKSIIYIRSHPNERIETYYI